MKGTISIVIAIFSLLISVGTLTFQLKSKPLGDGIEKYSFAEPIDAYKAILQMEINKDILAQMQFNAAIWAISDRKVKEQLETIKISKTREYEGKTILFIEYNEAGLLKRDFEGMEKDADSGFWHKALTSEYEMEDKNPALAAEIKQWKK